MATKFLNAGGDETFNVSAVDEGGFWIQTSGASIVTDFVHGSHKKSMKFPASASFARSIAGVASDSGTRISIYFYFVALPSATTNILRVEQADSSRIMSIDMTSAGILQLTNGASQIGSNGSALSTGQWYRLCLAYTITSTTINELRLFKDGILDISVTNATFSIGINTSKIQPGNSSTDASLDFRISDIYVDDSSSLTDTGDIWVTAKRPNANGTANNFGTQIGAGGSGYGTGHSPQVNERALSTTNGWSVVAVGATTEEYNIENAATGDISLSGATIIDYVGWVYAKALLSETASIVVNGASSNISLTSTPTMFTAVAGSSTYPAGTGTDIGIITDATATTVSLYECGIIVAYIPAVITLRTSRGVIGTGISR